MSLEIELEELKDLNHQLKKKLELQEALVAHCSQENEVLIQKLNDLMQSDCHVKCREAEKILHEQLNDHQLEEENQRDLLKVEVADLKQSIHALHQTLSAKEEELKAIKEDSLCVNDLNHSTNEKFLTEISVLEDKIEALCYEHDQYKNNVSFELNDLKEKLDIKQDALDESKRVLQDYKERLEEAEVKMANLQMLPKNTDERGNSVFGELEDRRVKAETKLKVCLSKMQSLKQQLQSTKAENERLSGLYRQAINKKHDSTDKDIDLFLKRLDEGKKCLQTELERERENCHYKKDLEQHLSACEDQKKVHKSIDFVSKLKNIELTRMQKIVDHANSQYWKVNVDAIGMKRELHKLKDLNQYLQSKYSAMKQQYFQLKQSDTFAEKENTHPELSHVDHSEKPSDYKYGICAAISDLDDDSSPNSQLDWTYQL